MTERQVVVNVTREMSLDPERIEEYVRATFDDGDYVQIQDVKTGESYFDNIGSDTLFPKGDRNDE